MNIQTESIKSIKGMADILPPNIHSWQFLEAELRLLMASYGYDEVRFPILEKSDLFIRSIGEASDIVEKEMFTFQDKDKAQSMLSMRPEGTASTVRMCIEHGLIRNQQQQRLWYMGPMFRRERPQKGRYRQFHHLGVESFGFAGSQMEAEHIIIAHNLWRKLGILSEVKLELNSIGNTESRAKYIQVLTKYFNDNIAKLDEDSHKRLTKNPLRILDSKNPAMQDLIANAPSILDYLDDTSKQNFAELQNSLQELGISFTINPKIVRGLDYYNGAVYEWTTTKLGSQSAISAGGRYDSLSTIIGGPETYSVGFAIGLERVLLLMEELGVVSSKRLDCFLIAVGDKAAAKSLAIAEQVRKLLPNISLMVNIGGGNFKTQFKRADKSGARFALVLGEAELESNKFGIKFLREEREQLNVTMEDLVEILGGLCADISN